MAHNPLVAKDIRAASGSETLKQKGPDSNMFDLLIYILHILLVLIEVIRLILEFFRKGK